MPMYDYKCNNCTHEWVELCLYKETEQRCPECESMNTKRLVSAPNIKQEKSPYDYI